MKEGGGACKGRGGGDRKLEFDRAAVFCCVDGVEGAEEKKQMVSRLAMTFIPISLAREPSAQPVVWVSDLFNRGRDLKGLFPKAGRPTRPSSIRMDL